jgi:hypothetical protein
MSVSVLALSLDCSDAEKLGSFWSRVLDRPLDPGPTAEFASIGLAEADGGPAWMFHQVPEPKQAKNRVHIDFVAPDLAEEVQRVVTLEARHVRDVDEGGYQWATLLDTEGNEFDIVAAPQ